MINKQDFINSISNEYRIIKHLCTKLSPEMYDYRPAPKMRSTLELLQYLCMCGNSLAEGSVTGNWNGLQTATARVSKLSAAEIPAALEAANREITELLSSIPDADFLTKEVTFPWGPKNKLGMALVESSLKFLTAYRLQLFLYAKMSGRPELNTMNCWGGIDGAMPGQA